MVLYCSHSIADGSGGGIALCTGCKIDGALRKNKTGLRITYLVYRVKRGIGHNERGRISITYIFTGEYQHPTGDEFYIFASLDHPRQPVHGSVRIAAAHGFDKCGYD